MHRKGLSLIEVMMALVILGIVTQIFFQTTKYSQANQGKTRDWTAESAVIEKTIESLRSDYSMTVLQSFSNSWIDSSQGGTKIAVSVQGSVAPSSVATGFPPDMLAQVQVKAKRVGDTDSLAVSTILWVN